MQNEKKESTGPSAGGLFSLLAAGIKREAVTIIICLVAVGLCWYVYSDADKIVGKCNTYYQDKIKDYKAQYPSCFSGLSVNDYSAGSEYNLDIGGYGNGNNQSTDEHIDTKRTG